MNKKIITASAASLVLAAMPVVGAFAAAQVDGSVIDTITITVSESCTLGATDKPDVSATIAPGQMNDSIAGSTFSITCNDGKGWDLTAVGAGSGEDKTTLTTDASGSEPIPTSTNISEDTSSWAFKLSGTGLADGYQNGGWAVIPGESGQIIASSNGTTNANLVNVTYGVGIAPDQAEGTYTGKVTYSLTSRTETD